MGKLMDTYMSKKTPMGMHKMSSGMMMSDKEMEGMMGKKASKKKKRVKGKK